MIPKRILAPGTIWTPEFVATLDEEDFMNLIEAAVLFEFREQDLISIRAPFWEVGMLQGMWPLIGSDGTAIRLESCYGGEYEVEVEVRAVRVAGEFDILSVGKFKSELMEKKT